MEHALVEVAFARFALLAGVMLVIGAVVGYAAVLRRVLAPVGSHADPPRAGGPPRPAAEVVRVAEVGQIGAFAVLAAAAVLLAAQASDLTAGEGDAFSPALLGALLRGTSWGRGWGALVLAAGVSLVAFTRARRRRDVRAWWTAAAAAAVLAAAPAFMGHAASDERQPALALVSDWLHVAGAGAWLGGLAAAAGAAWAGGGRPARRTTAELAGWLAAFSPVALMGAATVAATGLVSGWLRLTHGGVPLPAALGTTAYGRLLLAKATVAAGVAALGGHNWRRLTPRVAAGDPEGVAAMQRSVVRELALAGVVLAVTAVLVATSPPEVQ